MAETRSFPVELRAAALIAASNLVALSRGPSPTMDLAPMPKTTVEQEIVKRMEAILLALPKDLRAG